MFVPPQIRAVGPEHMLALADTVDTDGVWQGLANVPRLSLRLPLRTFDEVRSVVEQGVHGPHDEVSVLEWLRFVYASDWDACPDSVQDTLAKLVWRVAYDTAILYDVLVVSVVEHVVLRGRQVSQHLVANLINDKSDRMTVLAWLLEGRWAQLARSCVDLGVAPERRLRLLGFPRLLDEQLMLVARECVAAYVAQPRPVRARLQNWLLEALRHEDDVAVECLIVGLAVDEVGLIPAVKDWVLQHYGPNMPGTRWEYLSLTARNRLLEWAGSLFFEDFERVIDAIVARKKVLQLQAWELNQLQGRIWFWSAYKARFRQIRVLLPQKTLTRIDSEVVVQSGRLDQLSSVGEQVEVCLFDFGTHIVAEVFRGAGEVRVIEATAPHREMLFDRDVVGIPQIRDLPALLVHDHGYLWQSGLPIALKHRGIAPSPGVTSMRSPVRGSGKKYSERPISFRMEKDKLRSRQDEFVGWLPHFIAMHPDGLLRSRLAGMLPNYTELGSVEASLRRQARVSLIPGPPGTHQEAWFVEGEKVCEGTLDKRPGNDFGFVRRPFQGDVFVAPHLIADNNLAHGMKVRVLYVQASRGPSANRVERL